MAWLRNGRSIGRELLVALFCALVVLTGLVQARAGTEFAGRSGFSSQLSLCLPSGEGGQAPEGGADCDHCRMPASVAFAVPNSLPLAVPSVARRAENAVAVVSPTIRLIEHPEARGPPARA